MKALHLLAALGLLGSASFAIASDAVFSEDFTGGIKAWTVQNGQANAGRENGGTLVLKSTRQADGEKRSGAALLEISGLKPHQSYELSLQFRFEKDFADAWPWAKVELWEAGSDPASGNTSLRITEHTITPQKRNRSEVTDREWRTIKIPFNPGADSSITLRLLNHPNMFDQTHWDSIEVRPLKP